MASAAVFQPVADLQAAQRAFADGADRGGETGAAVEQTVGRTPRAGTEARRSFPCQVLIMDAPHLNMPPVLKMSLFRHSSLRARQAARAIHFMSPFSPAAAW